MRSYRSPGLAVSVPLFCLTTIATATDFNIDIPHVDCVNRVNGTDIGWDGIMFGFGDSQITITDHYERFKHGNVVTTGSFIFRENVPNITTNHGLDVGAYNGCWVKGPNGLNGIYEDDYVHVGFSIEETHIGGVVYFLASNGSGGYVANSDCFPPGLTYQIHTPGKFLILTNNAVRLPDSNVLGSVSVIGAWVEYFRIHQPLSDLTINRRRHPMLTSKLKVKKELPSKATTKIGYRPPRGAQYAVFQFKLRNKHGGVSDSFIEYKL